MALLDCTQGTQTNFLFPEKIKVKNSTMTFNHTHLVVIGLEKVFCKRKNLPADWVEEEPCVANRDWYPIPLPKDVTPTEVFVDGANMIVIDQLRFIHYKKMIHEKRMGDLYFWRDLTLNNNWKEKGWYSFPFINVFTRLVINSFAFTVFRFIPKATRDKSDLLSYFSNTMLKIPVPNRGCAISHRGQLCHKYRDVAGKEHTDETGVTQFVWLAPDGKSLWYADPWLPFGFVYKMPFPEDKSFEAQSVAISASTLFLPGHSVVDGKKVVKFFTGQFDFDILGYHPLRTYTRDPNNTNPDAIFLPAKGWVEEAGIPLKGKATLTKIATIFQTEKINKGIGNDARKLHIVGTNENGDPGYYTKALRACEWKFKPFPFSIKEEDSLEAGA